MVVVVQSPLEERGPYHARKALHILAVATIVAAELDALHIAQRLDKVITGTQHGVGCMYVHV